ncbi:Venom serine protease 34 [Pseudolycoriella hygida]|uniref:Venom serine protease 34 n=1 Tax=Pseudolycoriella hygida TaxID=35572 RepID=A0A9Q0NB38_9DIPT|nr:Venom serine protease 34 [Pseudolycoriella hygida]
MPQYMIVLIVFFTSSAQSQFTGCDYFQSVVPGQTYDVFSPNYGGYYPGGTNCRWRAVGPTNSKLIVNCIDVTLPQNNCNDRLVISWSGTNDPNPSWYCGSQTFSASTSGNQVEIELRSQATGYAAGRFRCQLTVQIVTITPNQCDCGRRKTSRVVNGEITGVNEFTMMAGLVDTRDRFVFCGGTIISKNHVLTSAHCLTNRQPTSLSVLVGDHDYTSTSDTPYAIFYPVSKFTVHANFDRNSNINDIGIITTTSTIAYNVAVGPACLPFAYQSVSFVDTIVEATGWGTIFFGGEISTTLRKVSLNVISNTLCSQYFSNIAATQICVKTPTKDTCQRDSGGPLYGTINGQVFLIGIISYGQGCATDYPSVNTRVTSYLSWIQENTPGAVYCR